VPDILEDGVRSIEFRIIQCKECAEHSGEWVKAERYPSRRPSIRDPKPWDVAHKGKTGHRRYWHHAYVRNHGEVW
jgi:hypothetical protein